MSRGIQFSPEMGIEFSPAVARLVGLRTGLRALQEAGLDLLLEPVAVAPDGDGDPMMEQAVQDGGGNHPVPES